ncbi:hypothetical protein AVEN_111845-1 [Araneus ventricosus]|uniref:DNA helicase Pif1-like 2B domain-containing protein n=1 Tax=Araneus ventricosus TaxID=182803 RepID=A0A4Y2BYS6_ARAVE|nr:hypothetical protein AVEN_111845-1 [Araneus ventricosus]
MRLLIIQQYTLEPSGVPSHMLELKIGAPISFLRNLHPPSLCNGTRLCIKKLMPNIMKTQLSLNMPQVRKFSFLESRSSLRIDLPFRKGILRDNDFINFWSVPKMPL